MDWDEMLKFVVFVFGMIVSVVGAILVCALMCGWVISGFEYNTWNKMHGTNYTHYDWFTGSDFIQKYHYPDRDKTEKKEINVNLNQ